MFISIPNISVEKPCQLIFMDCHRQKETKTALSLTGNNESALPLSACTTPHRNDRSNN